MNATITIKASKALVEQLKPIAVANRRSVTQEINVALEAHIRANPKDELERGAS
jgi:predicted transcriptional regulator